MKRTSCFEVLLDVLRNSVQSASCETESRARTPSKKSAVSALGHSGGLGTSGK